MASSSSVVKTFEFFGCEQVSLKQQGIDLTDQKLVEVILEAKKFTVLSTVHVRNTPSERMFKLTNYTPFTAVFAKGRPLEIKHTREGRDIIKGVFLDILYYPNSSCKEDDEKKEPLSADAYPRKRLDPIAEEPPDSAPSLFRNFQKRAGRSPRYAHRSLPKSRTPREEKAAKVAENKLTFRPRARSVAPLPKLSQEKPTTHHIRTNSTTGKVKNAAGRKFKLTNRPRARSVAPLPKLSQERPTTHHVRTSSTTGKAKKAAERCLKLTSPPKNHRHFRRS